MPISGAVWNTQGNHEDGSDLWTRNDIQTIIIAQRFKSKPAVLLRVKGKKLMQKEKRKRRGGSRLWALVLWTPMATFPVMTLRSFSWSHLYTCYRGFPQVLDFNIFKFCLKGHNVFNVWNWLLCLICKTDQISLCHVTVGLPLVSEQLLYRVPHGILN